MSQNLPCSREEFHLSGCQHHKNVGSRPGRPPADRGPHPIQKNLGHHHTLRLKLSGSSSGFLLGKTKPKFGHLSSGKLTKKWWKSMDFPGKLIYQKVDFPYLGSFTGRYIHPQLSSMKQLGCPNRGRFRSGRWDSTWLSTRGGTGIGGGFLVGLFSLFPDLLPLQLALPEVLTCVDKFAA